MFAGLTKAIADHIAHYTGYHVGDGAAPGRTIDGTPAMPYVVLHRGVSETWDRGSLIGDDWRLVTVLQGTVVAESKASGEIAAGRLWQALTLFAFDPHVEADGSVAYVVQRDPISTDYDRSEDGSLWNVHVRVQWTVARQGGDSVPQGWGIGGWV